MQDDQWRDYLVDDDAGLRQIMQRGRTIAVLGVKQQPSEPAYYVPAYLAGHGYKVLAVNPTLAGDTVLGTTIVGSLADLASPVDIIDVFRRPEYLPGHAREILALPWKPQAVWFQLGIRNDAAAQMLAQVGIRVVQDRCMMPEHRRLLGAA